MPSVLTGANLANRDLIYLGVSGDGDTRLDRPRPVRARHAPRRQHDLHRREQRGLRADQGPVLGHRRPGRESQARRGATSTRRSISSAWRCSSAPPLSARSFSGDKAQLVPLIKAALEHKGAAFIDCISPLRRVQQPRGLDQELRLRARAQRGGEPARRHHRPRRDHRRLCAGHGGDRAPARRLACCGCASSHADYDVTTASRR